MQQAWDQAIWPLLYTVEQWQGGTLRFWLRGVGYYAVLAPAVLAYIDCCIMLQFTRKRCAAIYIGTFKQGTFRSVPDRLSRDVHRLQMWFIISTTTNAHVPPPARSQNAVQLTAGQT